MRWGEGNQRHLRGYKPGTQDPAPWNKEILQALDGRKSKYTFKVQGPVYVLAYFRLRILHPAGRYMHLSVVWVLHLAVRMLYDWGEGQNEERNRRRSFLERAKCGSNIPSPSFIRCFHSGTWFGGRGFDRIYYYHLAELKRLAIHLEN